MPELIELRPFKSVKARQSYSFTTAESSSDSSDDGNSSNDESPFVFKLQSKPSKRNRMIQSLPIVINAQPTKKKKKRHRKTVQQFLINTQPASPKKKEIVIKQMMEPSYMPNIQYMPVSTSLPTIIERKPFVYQRVHTPSFVEERPFAFYNSEEPPIRRIVRVQPPNTRSVHLPKHAKKLVNRFLNGMEHAHGCRVSEKI
jgi:hypothetical protein